MRDDMSAGKKKPRIDESIRDGHFYPKQRFPRRAFLNRRQGPQKA
jgi:hypothetical protein